MFPHGGFTECLGEPRHVGVSTAGSLHTITLLPIPQGIVIEFYDLITSILHCYQSHSSSHCQQKEELQHYSQNYRDMYWYL